VRTAIFGTGGAGGYFGAQLAMAGEDVVFIARGEHLRAIQENGLTIEFDEGEKTVKAVATDDPATAGRVDVILMGVKTWQLKDAARSMLPMMRPDTFVVPLQNGVEAADDLAEIVGPERVVDGTCGTITRILGPGRLRSVGHTNFIRFGESDNSQSQRVLALRDMLIGAGVRAEIPDDIRAAVWKKFVFSGGCGGINAATRSPAGRTRSVPQTRALLERSIAEVVAIGQAMGVKLEDSVAAETLAFLDSLNYESTPSLLRDIAAGKPSELEAWTGAVVRLGRKAGVPTPVNDVIYSVLLPQELKARALVE
jgi:2-dehydropantoate 2-reductase